MSTPLTPEQARQAFDAVAARGDEIAFRWLAEGCECRAHLMIRHLQTLGITPGRAWAVSVGRQLTYRVADRPAQSYRWWNHVVPTVPVEGAEHGALVIDPSLSPGGPVTLTGWAASLTAHSYVVMTCGMTEREILELHTARVLQGGELDAVLFLLRLGDAPITNKGGSGFVIGEDPAVDLDAFARKRMKRCWDALKTGGTL